MCAHPKGLQNPSALLRVRTRRERQSPGGTGHGGDEPGDVREVMESSQRQSFEPARPSPQQFADGVLVAARHGCCGSGTSPFTCHFDLSPDSWRVNAGSDIITRPSALL